MKTLFFMISVFGMMMQIADAKIIPSDGLWQTYDDPAIGSGINIRTQGDITMVTIFTYREDGSPVWYFATGEIDDQSVFRAAMGETKNGEFLFNHSPQTAEIVNPNKTIELVFNATEAGTLSINESEPKPIHSYRFGIEGIETAQIITPTGNNYQFPDITGQWVMGSADENLSFSFDFFTYYGGLQDPPEPNFPFHFLNDFIQSGDILHYLRCPTERSYDEPYCQFKVDPYDVENNERAAILSRLYVFLDDIGVNTMIFHLQPEGDETYSREHPIYQAFRLNTNYEHSTDLYPRIFPVEGHWRTPDDPEIGSGLNFHSQGDIVMMTVFTYDNNGLPIWYVATGELGTEGGMEFQMVSTQGGTPIEANEPISAKPDQIKNVRMAIIGNQVVSLKVDDYRSRDVFNYIFGYPYFEASEHQQNSSDPLKIATPEGWWIMAQENAPSSLLLHLVKQTNKLTPPIPTDWVFFENQAASSDFIRGVECPTDYAYQWAYCGILLAEGHGGNGWGLSMNNMGATTWQVIFEDNNAPDPRLSYYMMHRIHSPIRP